MHQLRCDRGQTTGTDAMGHPHLLVPRIAHVALCHLKAVVAAQRLRHRSLLRCSLRDRQAVARPVPPCAHSSAAPWPAWGHRRAIHSPSSASEPAQPVMWPKRLQVGTRPAIQEAALTIDTVRTRPTRSSVSSTDTSSPRHPSLEHGQQPDDRARVQLSFLINRCLMSAEWHGRIGKRARFLRLGDLRLGDPGRARTYRPTTSFQVGCSGKWGQELNARIRRRVEGEHANVALRVQPVRPS
jgi:hypothetical protein